jgi:hypothetical protein
MECNFLNVLREFGPKGENVGYIGAEQAAQVSQAHYRRADFFATL